MESVSEPENGLVDLIGELIARRQQSESSPRELMAWPALDGVRSEVGRARHALDEGVAGYTHWLSSATRLLVADTSLRSMQSPLLNGAIRTSDLCSVVATMARMTPELAVLDLISEETVNQCLTRAHECPFRRIEEVRRAAPGLVFRATLSAATGLGADVAPRSSLPVTAEELVRAGIEIIRVIDPFNDLDRLVAAVTAASLSNAVVEGCVTLDGSLHPTLSGHISATVAVASSLERHGAQVIVIEDRNGSLRPVSAYALVRAVRREVSLPVWVRVVESGGYGLATLLSAVEAGAIGIDTVLPSFIGPGAEPDSVSLTSALRDTERRPEVDLTGLAAMDELVAELTERLGGWSPVEKPLYDAADRGATPQVFAEARRRLSGEALVSSDQILAACEAAWKALGHPSAVAPAHRGVVELATQMVETGQSAGPLLDRARVDDPQGLLDSVGSLREGGFPEGTITEVTPEGRTELLKLLWPDEMRALKAHQDRFGEIEMVPGEIARQGLGVGEELQLLENGEPRTVEVQSIDAGRAVISVNGQNLEITLPASED